MEEKQFHACMKKIKAGDKSALRKIYEEYIGYIYSISLTLFLRIKPATWEYMLEEERELMPCIVVEKYDKIYLLHREINHRQGVVRS